MTALSVRMRPDLVIESQGRDFNRYWIVKDPVSLQFFRLREEEYEILRMLDGLVSLEDLRRRFESLFAPLRLSAAQLQGFLWHLHELGLVVTDAPGQGGVLQRRAEAHRRRTLISAVANPLAIRLPGLPAAAVVEWLHRRTEWLFTAPVLIVYLATALLAAALLLLRWDTLATRLGDAQAFFSVQSVGWFLVAIMAIKTLHELGHALVCRHYGGQCPEIGVMFLVFSPTLYTDVTDAWRIESKWRRIMVSAAGMIVELALAAVAAILFSFSEPGTLNSFCLRVMFVCAVGSLLFNGNPLVRSDGYYILSDLIDAPNLWQDSRAMLQRVAARWMFGVETPEDPTIPERLHRPLLIYAALSIAYCSLLVVGILWFCFRVLEPQGLGLVALLLAGGVAFGMLAPPLWRMAQAVRRPTFAKRVRRGRAAVSGIVLVGLIAAVLLVPLPFRIAAPMWLEPAGAQHVLISTPGILQDALPPGTQVNAGEPLGKLTNTELEQDVAKAKAEAQQQELRLKHLRILLTDDPTAAPQIPAAEKACDDARQRLAQREREARRLNLEANVAGTVLPPPALPSPPAGAPRLAAWHGSPLDETNRGCYLETGALLCLVGDPQKLEAMLVIEQSDVALVRVGQRVRLAVSQGPVTLLTGKITDIARTDANDLPPGLVRKLDLPLKQHQADQRTVETLYQARVALDGDATPLLVGMTGRAKIMADWQPLALRFWRYVQRTFRLE